MDNIDWTKENILKIGNEVNYDIADDQLKLQRDKIEPWLTAVFQSEHLSLLAGTGLSSAITNIAEVSSQGMARITFEDSEYKDNIKIIADTQAETMGRGDANIEDDLRVAFDLYNGFLICDNEKAGELKKEIDIQLSIFISAVLQTEHQFLQSEKSQEALKYLQNFLFSFASRAATRDRLNIFTTNYDRFIEYACDLSGILILDRFVGKIVPVFRTNKLELDYHYNPPGIRGEPRYVEGVIRYTKIHGSLDWRFHEDQIVKSLLPFGTDSNHPAIPEEPSDHVVIYPNSSKGIETAFYPYSELFRDFSCAVSKPNSVIVTYGYGFGDSHINRILEDMLNIPSTHIVIIAWDAWDATNETFGAARKRIMDFVERNNLAQFTLLIGKHLGNIKNLVQYYLPKAAIDRITERETRYREKTGRNLLASCGESVEHWEVGDAF
jgi:hypothetical protein